MVILETPNHRVISPLIHANRVPAAAGRGRVAGAQALVEEAALLAGTRVLELLDSSAEALDDMDKTCGRRWEG